MDTNEIRMTLKRHKFIKNAAKVTKVIGVASATFGAGKIIRDVAKGKVDWLMSDVLCTLSGIMGCHICSDIEEQYRVSSEAFEQMLEERGEEENV